MSSQFPSQEVRTVTMLQEMPPVSACSVTGCGYNHDVSCHAGAITIGGDHAHCGTFIDITAEGGLDVQAHVGACHRAECRHNSSLECHADGVRVGPGQDVADCLTCDPAS